MILLSHITLAAIIVPLTSVLRSKLACDCVTNSQWKMLKRFCISLQESKPSIIGKVLAPEKSFRLGRKLKWEGTTRVK